MEPRTRELFDNLSSQNDKLRLSSMQSLLDATEDRVDWIYEVWEDLVKRMGHDNSYQRSIAIKLLCNLAKSDVENRIDKTLGALLAHTKDEKFITSRQCIQNLWKVAIKDKRARDKVVGHLERRFIRLDIVQTIKRIGDETGEDTLHDKAARLIESEQDDKHRKTYAAAMKR